MRRARRSPDRAQAPAAALLVCVAALAGAGCGRSASRAGASAGEARGDKPDAAPASAPGLPDVVDGAAFRALLQGLHEHVVVVNVWASWCQPCLGEFPELEAVAAGGRGRGIAVVGISVDDLASRETAVKAFLAALKPSFRMVERDAGPVDPVKAAIDEHWDGTVPTTFVLDRTGLVRATLKGPQKRADIENAIAAVTGEKPPPAPAKQDATN